MHLDNAFTELRSVLNHRQLDDGGRAKVWSLIQQASRWDEAAYMDQWMPYLSAFTQHWRAPLTHLKTQHALERAMRLCPFARFTLTMQTRHLVYSDTWFAQVNWSMLIVDLRLSQYATNKETIEHILTLPRLPYVRRLHANDLSLTTALASALLMWADGPHMVSLSLAHNNLNEHIADALHRMQARQSLVELNLRNSGLPYTFRATLQTTDWPVLERVDL